MSVKWTVRAWFIFGFTAFLYYLILALIFWKERMFHADSALYLFEILNNEIPFLGPRPGAVLTEAIPIIAHRAGASANMVGMLYSVSFPLVFGFMMILTYSLVKKVWVFPVFIFSVLLSTRSTFFNPVNETFLAMVLCAAAYSCLIEGIRKNETRLLVWGTGISLFALVTHPVSALIMSLLGMYLLHRAYISKQKIALPVVYLTAMLGFVGFSYVFARDAISDAQAPVAPEQGNMAWHFFQHHILDYSTHYLALVIVFAGIAAYLIFRGQWKLLVVLMMAGSGIAALNLFVYENGESALVLEKGWLPLGLMVMAVLPFVFSIRKARLMTVMLAVACVAAFLRFQDIGKMSATYTNRLEYLSSVARDNGNKVIALPGQLDMGRVLIPWNTGIETLLYSMSKGEQPATLFIASAPVPDYWLTDSTLFLGQAFDPVFHISELNPALFFNLEGKYTLYHDSINH
jgi:hypothetical protein